MITFDEPEFLMNPIINSPCDDGNTLHMMLKLPSLFNNTHVFALTLLHVEIPTLGDNHGAGN